MARGGSTTTRWNGRALAPVTMILLGLFVVACSGAPERAAPPAPPSQTPPAVSDGPTASVAPSAVPIVGEWEQLLVCDELAEAYRAAGLDPYLREMVYGSFLWREYPSAADIPFDPKDPCRDIEPIVHSHFFTEDGTFGSLDDRGEPVDDGAYELVGATKVVINDVTFRYRIRGDAITFDPVIPDCVPCFAAAWSVSVASPGGEWTRVG